MACDGVSRRASMSPPVVRVRFAQLKGEWAWHDSCCLQETRDNTRSMSTRVDVCRVLTHTRYIRLVFTKRQHHHQQMNSASRAHRLYSDVEYPSQHWQEQRSRRCHTNSKPTGCVQFPPTLVPDNIYVFYTSTIIRLLSIATAAPHTPMSWPARGR